MSETAVAQVTRLARHEEVAEGTMAFHFEKPAGFVFKAGQAVELLLADPGGGANDMGHAFSIVTAPFEGDLVIATRMRDSAYKKALKALAPGAEVRLDGPFGSLTLHNKRTRAAVFIAGGIGITPFMSMLRQAVRDGMPQKITLIYSNRRRQDSAFLGELEAMEKSNANFKLVTTMTEEGGAFVDAAMIAKATEGLPEPIFYVAGPPAMVEAMRKAIGAAGIDDDDIRSEDFYGY